MKLTVIEHQPLRVEVQFPSGQPAWVIKELARGTLTTMVNYRGRTVNLRQARPALFTPKSTRVEFVLADGVQA